MDGILIINKATGMTSHDVVAQVRKLLKQRRVGHAGTLDPAASGVLPICLGQATRVAEYLSESGKTYEAEITFGVVTDTYDAEGAVLRTCETGNLSREQVAAALPHFLGEQMQMPPRYSAIKLQGQPAYKRIRAGEEVTLVARPVVISRLDLLDWHSPRLRLAIECSKGTYIRSLAYDLGELLGCGAHLSALIRTRSGPFTLAEGLSLEQVTALHAQGRIAQVLLPADRALYHYPALTLDAVSAEHVLHGNAFQHPMPPAELARVYDNTGTFIAIAGWDKEHAHWQPRKVFDLPTQK